MTSKVSALNTTQKIPTTAINVRRVVSPFTFYTCPTGKKAIVKGKAVCTGLGAAASVRLNAAGIQIVEWAAAAVGNKILVIQTYFEFEIQLNAGETLDYSQDAGVNGELNVNATVQETPV